MDEKQELLKIYKLHTELFNQLSQQRTTTNRFYLVVMSTLFGIFIGFLQFADGLSMVVLMISFGVLGASQSIVWHIQIRSYDQLSLGKLQALAELEDRLAHAVFKRESESLNDEENPHQYSKLIFAETCAPGAFFAVFAALFIVGVYLLYVALR